MKQARYSKVIKVGDSLAVVIPAGVARELKLIRGDYLDLAIVDYDTIIAKRLKVVEHGNFEERKDDTVPSVNNG